MKIDDKKIAMTGYTGFLGKALSKSLNDRGATVINLHGDVRNANTFQQLDYTYDYLIHLGAPSSQILFKKSADYCVDVTVNGFRNAVEACKKNGIKLIFPSTGLLSHGQSNEYARAKQITEDIARGSDIDWLAVRIFGTYGPGDIDKRDFASVPWLFLDDIINGRPPIIYGDGTQERDFIFVDDTVEAIIRSMEYFSNEIVDIGTGKPVSFNRLIEIMNEINKSDIKPEYVNVPTNYIEKTGADTKKLSRHYTAKVSIEDGIRRLYDYAKSNSNNNNQ